MSILKIKKHGYVYEGEEIENIFECEEWKKMGSQVPECAERRLIHHMKNRTLRCIVVNQYGKIMDIEKKLIYISFLQSGDGIYFDGEVEKKLCATTKKMQTMENQLYYGPHKNTRKIEYILKLQMEKISVVGLRKLLAAHVG